MISSEQEFGNKCKYIKGYMVGSLQCKQCKYFERIYEWALEAEEGRLQK
jgi:hypothetical protein